MWRFVLMENIRRLGQMIKQENSPEERGRLQALLVQHERELADLVEASTSEAALHDDALQFLAQHAVDDAVEALGSQFGNMQIFSSQSDGLVIVAQRNFRAEFLHHFRLVRIGDGSACSRCLEHGQEVAIGDVTADRDYGAHTGVAADAGYRAVISAPIRGTDEMVFGVLSVHFANPQVFDADRLDLLAHLADRAGHSLGHYSTARPLDGA